MRLHNVVKGAMALAMLAGCGAPGAPSTAIPSASPVPVAVPTVAQSATATVAAAPTPKPVEPTPRATDIATLTPVTPEGKDDPKALYAKEPTKAPQASPNDLAPKTLAGGAFYNVGYKGSGQAKLIQQAGKTTLQLENFNVETGPDLVVWLVPGDPVAKGNAGVIQNGLLLGKLRANTGNQSYDLPSGTDALRYKSVVIWCREFNVAFVAAALRS